MPEPELGPSIRILPAAKRRAGWQPRQRLGLDRRGKMSCWGRARQSIIPSTITLARPLLLLLHGESRLADQVASVVNKTMKGIGHYEFRE